MLKRSEPDHARALERTYFPQTLPRPQSISVWRSRSNMSASPGRKRRKNRDYFVQFSTDSLATRVNSRSLFVVTVTSKVIT